LRRKLCDSVVLLIELWGRAHGLLYKGIHRALQIFAAVTGSEILFNLGNVCFNLYSAEALHFYIPEGICFAAFVARATKATKQIPSGI
jgi:hypothetical protein